MMGASRRRKTASTRRTFRAKRSVLNQCSSAVQHVAGGRPERERGARNERSSERGRGAAGSPDTNALYLNTREVGVALEFLEVVDGLDPSDGAGARAHHERLSRGAVGEVVDAFDQLAVGDTGQGEEHVAALNEVVDRQHAI